MFIEILSVSDVTRVFGLSGKVLEIVSKFSYVGGKKY